MVTVLGTMTKVVIKLEKARTREQAEKTTWRFSEIPVSMIPVTKMLSGTRNKAASVARWSFEIIDPFNIPCTG